LTEEANIGTVWAVRAGARIRVIGGERERIRYGHRLPLFIPQIAAK